VSELFGKRTKGKSYIMQSKLQRSKDTEILRAHRLTPTAVMEEKDRGKIYVTVPLSYCLA